MLLKISMFVLVLNFSGIFTEETTIECRYIQRGPSYPYTCKLSIYNPNGNDDFTNIPGDHLENFSDVNVTAVDVFLQVSTIVPQIICLQFKNLRQLTFMLSELAIINERSFALCGENLQSVTLIYNNIAEIPANTFRNNSGLNFIYLGNNNITTIHDDAFGGSAAALISLEFNSIRVFNSAPFEQVNRTLSSLNIFANVITELPSSGFRNLRNLQWLDLTANEFQSVPNDAFVGLENLTLLYAIQCNLSELRAEWFNAMPQLEELHLELNEIEELPSGVFSGLRRLNNLYLSYNELTQITSAPFGGSLINIEILSATNNQIFAIHAFMFLSAENINVFELVGNNCTNENHVNIHNDRPAVRSRLRRCFDNFGAEFIQCNFQSSDGDYSCILRVRNPFGNDFLTIDGEHLVDREDEDVVTVNAFEANTRAIPPVLCRQFVNLQNFAIISSYLEELTLEGFAECLVLERVDLSYNSLTTISNNVFRNNNRLREVNLRRNVINRIGFEAFVGTVIESLDLSHNEIFDLNSEWLEPINQTLRSLDLTSNRLAILSPDNFANLRNLEELILNGNYLYIIPANAFESLTNVMILGLSNCGIFELNVEWFATLKNLRHLSIASNELTALPKRIFNPLVNLAEIFFYSNRIVKLDAASFGASLETLTLLYGTSNEINLVDNEILTRATSLQNLLLYNNLCTQMNFNNVSDDIEVVRQTLRDCIDNFERLPIVECKYEGGESNAPYGCELNAINPVGLDTFDSIEGNHTGSNNDESVVFVRSERSNTLIVPSIICRQFPNLSRMDFYSSYINRLTFNSFSNCENLMRFTAIGNTIKTIPALVFSGARNLDMLVLSSNHLRTLSATAFYGTQIRTLDLSHNQISEFDPMVFSIIGSTLRTLRLRDNRIQHLPFESFQGTPNLVELELNYNRLQTIPSNVFAPLNNLQILMLVDCGVSRLNDHWFRNLGNLIYLQLSDNQINQLPENVFDLPMLEILAISGNNLRILDSNSLGRSLNSLFHIDASNNQINAFDPHIFDNATALFGLELINNLCIDNTFLEIPFYRAYMREYFVDCFEIFENSTMSCEFSEDEAIYICEMSIRNDVERLRFDRIEGDHLEGRNDNYVNHIRAQNGSTRSIPTLLCQQFRFLESIMFVDSGVEIISLETFRNCEFLFHLNLSGNRISSIPDGVFRENSYLSSLVLASNDIETISSGMFEGTQIYNLDLEDNRLKVFDPTSFLPIINNLVYLNLRHNSYTTLPRNAFISFRNLQSLNLNGNQLDFLPSNAFRNLNSLYNLEIAGCGLISINYRWFDDLQNLNTLEIDANGFQQLPNAVFDLPNLSQIGLAENRLTQLNSNAFGRSLNSLITIRAENNEINEIDPVIIDNASELSSLLLNGNVCVDVDFVDIQKNIETVRKYLNGCFENFRNATV